MNQKKGQFLILSAMLLFSASIFIYSQETVNTYKIPSSNFLDIESIQQEVCGLVKTTNGSNLPTAINNSEEDTSSYCNNRDVGCNLTIENTTAVPNNGNWSQHNYTHYNYSLIYKSSELEYNSSFTC